MRFILLILIVGTPSFVGTPTPLLARDTGERLKQARSDLAADRYNQAAAAYEEICPRVQTSSCWNQLGVVQMSLGGFRSALGSFQKAHKISPDSGLILSHMALAAFAARRRDLAGGYHLKALDRAPNNPDVRLNYGIYLYRARKFVEAEREFRRVLRDHPRNAFAHLQMGKTLHASGHRADALRHLNQGIAIDPSFFDLYYTRAVVKFRTGDMGGALTDLKRAEKINPINGRTGLLRKQIRRKMNRL